MYDEIIYLNEFIRRNRDNLFNADKRNHMIARYGTTSAEFIKIEELQYVT